MEVLFFAIIVAFGMSFADCLLVVTRIDFVKAGHEKKKRKEN
jgi:hypothetical protein